MTKDIITVSNVTKTAGSRQLLSNVSFTIKKKSLVSLIGPNGAGKSTLVKIMLGLDTDYAGSITTSPEERVQYIPQLQTDDQYQLPISVREYLRIGSSPVYGGTTQPVDLRASLSHVGVEPDFLDQSYSSLSGGERQRVAIARSLLSNPSFLVMDEPLAAVDFGSRQGLYELIRHLQQDHEMTVLLVSHDIDSVLPISDQVLCLNQTLHTDCHPTDISSGAALLQSIHHHC